MREIGAWYTPESKDALCKQREQNDGAFAPTPPEVEAGRRYSIEWPWGIDWSYGWEQLGEDRHPVDWFDRVVMVHPNTYLTWQGPQPFDALVAKLGGMVIIDADECNSYPSAMVAVTITCAAPDEAKAEWIELVLEDSIATGDTTYLPVALSDAPDDGDYLVTGRRYNRFYRSGNRLRLENICFTEGIVAGFQPLIEYLRAEGCTDIEYMFSEIG